MLVKKSLICLQGAHKKFVGSWQEVCKKLAKNSEEIHKSFLRSYLRSSKVVCNLMLLKKSMKSLEGSFKKIINKFLISITNLLRWNSDRSFKNAE